MTVVLSPSAGIPRLAEIQPGIPNRPRAVPPAPLLPVAIGLMLGIVTDEVMAVSWAFSTSLAVAGAVAAISTRKKRILGAVCLIIASAGVGAMRHALADRSIAADHIVQCTGAESAIVTLRGRVLTTPEIVEPSPDVPRAFDSGPKTKFLMEARTIAGAQGPLQVSGKVATTVKAPVLGLEAGDEIEMTGWLYRPVGPRNPGEYDRARNLRRDGVLVGFACDHAESVVWIAHRAGGGFARWIAALRTRLHGYLVEQAFDEDDPGAGVMSAVVLGLRSEVPRAMNEAFIKTGNAHFLAASGMNVAWLAMVIWIIARIIGLHYRPTAALVGVLIVIYVLVAEPQPSMLRAGIIGVLGCISIYLRGRPALLNWLSLAAIVILLINPSDLLRPAFQYTFLSVIALIVMEPQTATAVAAIAMNRNWIGLARRLNDHGDLFAVTLFDPSPSESSDDSWLLTVGVHLLRLATLAFSAWLLVTPLAIYQFDLFTPWGWFGTLALWFLAMPVTCVGFLTALGGVVMPSSTKLLGPLLGFGTDLLVGWVNLLAKIPFTQLNGRTPSAWWVIAVYAVMAIWLFRPQWMRLRHGFKIATCLLVLWWLVPPRWVKADSKALQVWMLAVGDGTGTVVELPNGKVLLCDLGTRSAFQASGVCEQFLRHRGIRDIDTAIVSHADFDHYSGVADIAKKFRVGRIVINDYFERFAPRKSGAAQFLDAVRALGVPIEVIHGPQRFEGMGDVVLEAVWPPSADGTKVWECNDTSIVLRLTYQDRSILLPGDISQAAIAELMAGGGLKADVLELPHHGSVVRNTAPFVEAVNPVVAVRSSGERRSLTINGIERAVGNRKYFSTADDGCVLVRIAEGTVISEAVTKNR